MMITIEAYMDYVLICGQRINRPASVARSEWLQFWETRYASA
jgi:hypothetical protein